MDRLPSWLQESEQRILGAISAIGLATARLSKERDDVRQELTATAEGIDRFLAELRNRLSKAELDFFLELIGTMESGVTRRVRTYREIGVRLGISKQAVQKRHKALSLKHPGLGEYVRSIRNPAKPQNFSEMSPSERRRQGIEDSFSSDSDG